MGELYHIMSQNKNDLNTLKDFLNRNKTATLDHLKKKIINNSTMSVFRKLKHLGYISSYSHRGKYYTLNSIAEFDETGSLVSLN